jgi:hypothetical protein
MKYLKLFEDRNINTEYAKIAKIGDIIVCTREPSTVSTMQKELKYGNKYEILSIEIPDPEGIQYYYFDLKDLKTQNILIGWGAILFQPEIQFDSNKYNL